ncbi:MAG: hypothetical protein SNF93_07205 [Rikenellaceae bacterium]
MSKKIFICGRVYDLSAHKPTTIEKRIQKRIDKITCDPDEQTGRLINFSMKVTPIAESPDYDVEFTFARNNLFAKEGVNPDFLNDSDGQFMMGMDGRFRPPVMWNMVQPFTPGRYDIPLSEFVYAYAKSAKALEASEIIGLQIESSKKELKLKIRV